MKGSGLGIYVNESYEYNNNYNFTMTKPHMESLFITITNLDKPLTFGIIYHPPNGNVDSFLNEFETYLKNYQTEMLLYLLIQS